MDLQNVVRPGYETYYAEQLLQEIQHYLFWLDFSIVIPKHCFGKNRVVLTCFKQGTKLLNHFAAEIRFQNRFHGNGLKESKEYCNQEGYQYFVGIAVNPVAQFGLYMCPANSLDYIFLNKEEVEKFIVYDKNGNSMYDFYYLDYFSEKRKRIIGLSNNIVQIDQCDKKSELPAYLREYSCLVEDLYDFY
jgi:hypothetical protein